MIVDDLDVRRTCSSPPKANPILIVHPDAILPRAVAFERFEAGPGSHAKVVQAPGNLQLTQLPSRNALNAVELADIVSTGAASSVPRVSLTAALIATIMLLPLHRGFNVHSWSRPNASFTDERRLPTRGDDRTALGLRGSRMEASSHSSGAPIHAFADGESRFAGRPGEIRYTGQAIEVFILRPDYSAHGLGCRVDDTVRQGQLVLDPGFG